MKFRVSNLKNIIVGFAIIAVVIVIDQVTKLAIMNNYTLGQKNIVTIIDNFLYISHVKNIGAAWSIFQGNTFVLIGVTSVALILALVFMVFTDRIILTIPVAMIIGGGLGNLIDRIFRKGVVDFIDAYIFGYDFPVFNAADMSLVCGTILLAIYILFLYKDSNPGFRRIFKWQK